MVIPGFVKRWSLSLSFVVLALVGLLVASPVASADGGISLEGNAISVSGTLNGQFFDPVNVVPPQSASLASFSLPGVVSATSLQASSSASGSTVHSQASVEYLTVIYAGVTIQADAVSSQGEATCSGGQAVLHASTSVTNLRINGVLQTLTGVNQVITLPGNAGPLYVNLQVTQPASAAYAVYTYALFADGDRAAGSFAAGYTEDFVLNCPAPH